MTDPATQYARFALPIWAAWVTDGRQYGWPSQSSEMRAFESAQRAIVTGRRRYICEPPPWPKETRPTRSAIVPKMDSHILAPQTDRALRDLESESEITAGVLKISALVVADKNGNPISRAMLADAIEVSHRDFRRIHRIGSTILGTWLLALRCGPQNAKKD